MLALAIMPVAVSVALSLSPLAVGAYLTVTVHDLPGPRLFPVQLSVVVNADPPGGVIVSAHEALPPEFSSVNVTSFDSPVLSVP
jgi:hypothetical protein